MYYFRIKPIQKNQMKKLFLKNFQIKTQLVMCRHCRLPTFALLHLQLLSSIVKHLDLNLLLLHQMLLKEPLSKCLVICPIPNLVLSILCRCQCQWQLVLLQQKKKSLFLLISQESQQMPIFQVSLNSAGLHHLYLIVCLLRAIIIVMMMMKIKIPVTEVRK